MAAASPPAAISLTSSLHSYKPCHFDRSNGQLHRPFAEWRKPLLYLASNTSRKCHSERSRGTRIRQLRHRHTFWYKRCHPERSL